MRAIGNTLEEIAEEMGLATTTVCRRLKVLGLQLADHAGVEINHQR